MPAVTFFTQPPLILFAESVVLIENAPSLALHERSYR